MAVRYLTHHFAADPARRSILCVDDHEDTLLMLSALLSHANHDVTVTSSVGDALWLACNAHFDLYIFDKLFPQVAGLYLCRKVREFDPETPIIIYSGDVRRLSSGEAQTAGAHALLTKPDIERLVEMVHCLLRRE